SISHRRGLGVGGGAAIRPGVRRASLARVGGLRRGAVSRRASGGALRRTRSERPLNILVVDDDPAALAYLSGVLRERHGVTACGDGGDALARLESRAFDVVFTDLRMPAPDGFEVLRAAQALDPPVPVIVLTAVDCARP